MSLYKGLGFGAEKPAVIIDIGKAFSKCVGYLRYEI